MTKSAKLRCAVYTRKSSDEGLEQSFNSLHAQREACEAYIKSQAHEGWVLVKTAYDDGGFSGGSMERPGLAALLADVERGLVDVVVVYKVDRLTRSLFDFSKIIELLDRQKVSFVSITQAFNTTTSMGRLTLNVLLSFAQFEREVTSERIRDKIAASKAKGMWMGGKPPLGYDGVDRALVPNPTEVLQVRTIFERYLELRSVAALAADLEGRGIGTKRTVLKDGREVGGGRFQRGQLYHLLQNQTYFGRTVHKDKVHPGLHPPILDQHLFDAVQQLLAEQRRRPKDRIRRTASSPLKGRIFDSEGDPMSPTSGRGHGGSTYRYYVSNAVQRGAKAKGQFRHRIAAEALEKYLTQRISTLLDLPDFSTENLQTIVQRCVLYPAKLSISLSVRSAELRLAEVRAKLGKEETAEFSRNALNLTLSISPILRGGRTWIHSAPVSHLAAASEPDPVLIAGLRQAHRLLREQMLPRRADWTS